MESILVRDRPPEDRLIGPLLLPWDSLTAFISSLQRKLVIWRYQALHESIIIRSGDAGIADDTECRVIVEVGFVCFSAKIRM